MSHIYRDKLTHKIQTRREETATVKQAYSIDKLILTTIAIRRERIRHRQSEEQEGE